MKDTEQPGHSKNTQYDEGIYELKLYVVGNNKKSQMAFANLKDICHKYLAGKCHIEVIDLKKNPDLARIDQIVAIPTLIRKNYPGRRIVGDLSNYEKVLETLDLNIFNLMGVVNEKDSAEKTSTEESKARIVRLKDDLQPYIGSGLCRQRSQNPDKWTFYLPYSPC